MNEIVPSATYDFSKYKPGDVIVLRMHDVIDKRVRDQMDDLVAYITVECRRRRIEWTMEHDKINDEVRIMLR